MNRIKTLDPIPRASAHRTHVGAEIVLMLAAWCILCALAMAMVFALAGCRASATNAAIHDLNNRTAVSVAQVTAQNKVDVAKAAAKGKLQDAQASATPVSHPIAAANQATKRLQVPLEVIATVAGIAFAVFVGLLFTPLSFVSKIGLPVAGCVAGLSYFGAIALPFFPWVLAAAAALLLGLFVYEIIRYRSLKKAVAAIESDIGLTPATISSAVTSAASSAGGSLGASIGSTLSSVVTSVESEGKTLRSDAEKVLGIAGTKAAPIEATTIVTPKQ